MKKTPSWDRFFRLLGTHKRECEVLYYPHRISFEIPIMNKSEREVLGTRINYLRVDIPNDFIKMDGEEMTIVLNAKDLELK